MLKASYLLLVLAALFLAFRLIFQFAEPNPALGNRIFAGIGGPALALIFWPWPRSRLRVLHIARVVSGVAFGSALFVLPILIDQGGERSKSVNVGLLSLALVLHGLVILIVTEYLRSANDNNQKDLVVTCREVLYRVERLEGKLEERDQALAIEVQAMAAAVDRLERRGPAKQSWVGRLRQLL
jgi:hypothetical protein